jgi:hypothetical protein
MGTQDPLEVDRRPSGRRQLLVERKGELEVHLSQPESREAVVEQQRQAFQRPHRRDGLGRQEALKVRVSVVEVGVDGPDESARLTVRFAHEELTEHTSGEDGR